MLFSPLQFLGFAIMLTAAARLAYVVRRNRWRRELQRLAREWRMHYSPHDRFDLGDRMAESFPLPGAAEIRAVDLIYGTEHSGEGEFYRYIFTVEYTAGVVRAKHRFRRVVTFREPKGRPSSAHWSQPILAPEEQEPIVQYKSLHERIENGKQNVESQTAPLAASQIE